MADRTHLAIVALIAALGVTMAADGAKAEQAIGSATSAQNQVTREISGATAPLAAGDSVFRNEVVRTGADSLAKLVFLDSTNLAVGPTSRVVLDRFVYEGDPGAEKVAVGLAKGLFRFTTGTLDKKAYTINTPTAAIGVRGTILDIDVTATRTDVTLREGSAIVCARGGGCVTLNESGQTAQAKKVGGTTKASLTNNPVNFSSLCSGNASLCSGATYASSGFTGPSGGGGAAALCGR